VAQLGVVGVAREHRDLGGQVAAQLGDHRMQDRFVAEIEAAVGTRDTDPVQVFGHVIVGKQKESPAPCAGWICR
jgi:hypothetical protein